MQSTHIVEQSFFVVPLDSKGRPTRSAPNTSKIILSDIDVSVQTSPQEGLLYGTSMLNADETKLVQAWIIENYTLLELQIASELILEELENTPSFDLYFKRALEQRTQILADASLEKAAQEASETCGMRRGLRRITKRIPSEAAGTKTQEGNGVRKRVADILREREAVEQTLAQFNVKIAQFAKDDSASAEMLVPAKLDLEEKLVQICTRLAALGVQPDSRDGSVPKQDKDKSGCDEVGADASCTSPREHKVVWGHEECTSEDEDDYRMALPIDGSEYDVPFAGELCENGGYVSSESSSLSPGGPLSRNGESKSVLDAHLFTMEEPGFVIDLSATKSEIDREAMILKGRSGERLLGYPDDEMDSDDYDTLYLDPSPRMKSDFAMRHEFPRDDAASSGSSAAGDCSSDLERPPKRSPRERHAGSSFENTKRN